MSLYADYDFIHQKYDNVRFPIGAKLELGYMFVELGKPPSEWHLLDIGCGTGNYTKIFLDNGVGKVTLLDGNSAMLKRAQEKLKPYFDNGKIVNSVHEVLPNLPFPENTFDAATINVVMHHLYDETAAGDGYHLMKGTLKNVYKVLKPHGVLCILTCGQHQGTDSDWADGFFSGSTRDFYLKQYPPLDFVDDMITNAGFKIVDHVVPLKERFVPSDELFYSTERLLNRAVREGYNSSWAKATPDELVEIEKKVKEMSVNGELQDHIKLYDEHRKKIGLATVIVAKKEQ